MAWPIVVPFLALAAAVAAAWWLAWRLPPRRRPGVRTRLAARLGGHCAICGQVGHTSQEHVRLPNRLLQGRHRGDWGDLCG